MIKEIKIQNYKLFKELHLKDLPPILLIGGQNSCGKSSLLEALYLPLSFDCASILVSRHIYQLQGTFWFRSFFSNMNFKAPVIIEYKEDSPFRKIKLEGVYSTPVPLHFHTQSKISGETMSTPIQNGLKITFWEDIHKAHKETLLYAMQNQFYYKDPHFLPLQRNPSCFLYPSGLLTSIPVYINLYSKLILEDHTYYETFLKALQIVHPNLKSLSVLSPEQQTMIYGDTGEQKIPLSLMGGGINRLMSILLAISASKNRVVFIDELENGFHHSVLPRVWEVITKHAKSCNTQIIATTHSWELISSAIEGVPEDLRPDFQYRRLERQKNSTFRTVDYDFSTLKTAVMSHLETR